MIERDILTIEDIRLLVDGFYAQVRQDALLGPIFDERIGDRWPEHLEKMYRFWQTVLLDEHSYFGSPFPPHASLPVAHEHFERWMALFNATVQNMFAGEKAEEAKWRAAKMAEMFELKINYYRDRKIKPLI